MASQFSKKYGIVIMLLVMLVHFTNCERNLPVPIYTDQGNIGPEGGIVKTSDGASVEIPRGAINTNKSISITNITGDDSNGYMIYELGPDGLVFSDSVTINLPFDDSYLDLSSDLEDYGIGVMVFQDSLWVRLRAEIDLVNKVARIKTLHFSSYAIRYTSILTLYFLMNKDKPKLPFNVPYYAQTDNWCGYYSLSMVLKYAGYSLKAPYLATLFDEPDSDNSRSGMQVWKFLLLPQKLDKIGISTKITTVPFLDVYELSGFVLSELDRGNPVFLISSSIGHAFVVTGHDQTGFFINDPSGAFLKAANTTYLSGQPMVHVSYQKFRTALITLWDLIPILGGEYAMVITSSGDMPSEGLSLNFFDGHTSLKIIDQNDPWLFQSPEGSSSKGELNFCGGYKSGNKYVAGTAITVPHAYSCEPEIGFDGSDYIYFDPVVTNSDLDNKISCRLHFKIDDKDLDGSPLTLSVDKGNSKQSKFISQLNNLNKGKHLVSVELRSANSNQIIDFWNFYLNIDNAYHNTFTDPRDGHVYKYVTIGTQTWMAENLAYLPAVNPSSSGSWDDVRYYVYNYQGTSVANAKATSNFQTYGVLYNWPAANTGCPTGWRLPTNAELITLATHLGGDNIAGGKLKESGTLHWISPNTGATNETGFTALPGGVRLVNGTFSEIGMVTYYWSSTLTDDPYRTYWGRALNYNDSKFQTRPYNSDHGLSVRCIKNK